MQGDAEFQAYVSQVLRSLWEDQLLLMYKALCLISFLSSQTSCWSQLAWIRACLQASCCRHSPRTLTKPSRTSAPRDSARNVGIAVWYHDHQAAPKSPWWLFSSCAGAPRCSDCTRPGVSAICKPRRHRTLRASGGQSKLLDRKQAPILLMNSTSACTGTGTTARWTRLALGTKCRVWTLRPLMATSRAREWSEQDSTSGRSRRKEPLHLTCCVQCICLRCVPRSRQPRRSAEAYRTGSVVCSPAVQGT